MAALDFKSGILIPSAEQAATAPEMIYLFIPEQFIMPDSGTIYTKIYKNSMTGLIYKNETLELE